MFGEIGLWGTIIQSPMINALVMLSHYLFNSFGLTIIVFTVVIRALMYPLTLKQLQASKKMQTVQAEVAEIRKKYAKDKKKAAEEQMRLLRQSGTSPAGCLVPILIQMPLWIALYQAILKVLAVVPEDFLSLSQYLYSSWPLVFSQVPLENRFLWLDLAVPDRWMLLPILVGVTQWVQQKMMTAPSPDPKQQAQAQMMLWMMPMMFVLFSLSFPSGLALYWLISNVIGIATQYLVTGWGGLVSLGGKRVVSEKKIRGQAAEQEASLSKADIVVEPAPALGEGVSHEESGDKRQNRRRSYTTRPKATGRKPRGGGDHRRTRR